MIAEIKIKNMFSFKDEAVLSFEADKSKDMETYHVVQLAEDVRLLKVAVVYGANAAGKSNLIKAYDFIKIFISHTPLNKAELIQVYPFLLDGSSRNQVSEFSITFYITNGNRVVRYVYAVALTQSQIVSESLVYYPHQQPVNLFERLTENKVSTIKFSRKLNIGIAAKELITLKCLPNMSVFAAYMQVNTYIDEIETVLQYLTNQMMPAVLPTTALNKYAAEAIKQEDARDYILKYLQEADFNVSNISIKEQNTPNGLINHTIYQHKVTSSKEEHGFYDFPELFESDGTVRTFGLAASMQKLISHNSFLAVDDIESSLHPNLIEFIIERFLQESERAQLLLTTHYDGLLGDGLLRNDNIWFTEKNKDGSSTLYPLTDFKGLNRLGSLSDAYKLGKLGAVPNL